MPQADGFNRTSWATTEEKLGNYTGTVDWKYLQPHFLSGVLYFVDPSLALIELGGGVFRLRNDSAQLIEVGTRSSGRVVHVLLHGSITKGGVGEWGEGVEVRRTTHAESLTGQRLVGEGCGVCGVVVID